MHFIIPKFSTKSLHKIPDNVKLCIWRSLGYRYTKIQQKIITKKRTGSRNKENMYFHNVENLQTLSNEI